MAALIRAAISRRDRSTSARSASSRRDASSASIRRALLIDAAAWSASARTRPIADGLNASALEENAPSAPKTVSPDDQRGDDHRADADVDDDAVGLGRVREGGVIHVVAGHHHGPLRDRPPEHPDADREVDAADPVPAAPAADARVVGEAQVTGRRVDEVDHRAVGIEQPGGLVDGGLEQLVDLAAAAVRVGAGRAWARRRLGAVGRRPVRSRRGAAARRVRGLWWEWSRAEDTRPPRSDGIAVRRWRLRHPAEAATVARRRRRRDQRPRRFAVACPPCAPGDAAPTMRPDSRPTARHRQDSEVHSQMFAARTPLRTVRRHRPRRHRRSRPRHGLHPLHARRPAVHAERRRLCRRRRRDDRPARPRRPLPLGRPRRPDRLRRDRDRRLGRSWARTSPPPTSPRPSKSP